jgi:hypothetical protein
VGVSLVTLKTAAEFLLGIKPRPIHSLALRAERMRVFPKR